MINYYLDQVIVFLPVDNRKLAARGISPKFFCTRAALFEHVATLGDGVAHTRVREAGINIMIIMRKRIILCRS